MLSFCYLFNVCHFAGQLLQFRLIQEKIRTKICSVNGWLLFPSRFICLWRVSSQEWTHYLYTAYVSLYPIYIYKFASVINIWYWIERIWSLVPWKFHLCFIHIIVFAFWVCLRSESIQLDHFKIFYQMKIGNRPFNRMMY